MGKGRWALGAPPGYSKQERTESYEFKEVVKWIICVRAD